TTALASGRSHLVRAGANRSNPLPIPAHGAAAGAMLAKADRVVRSATPRSLPEAPRAGAPTRPADRAPGIAAASPTARTHSAMASPTYKRRATGRRALRRVARIRNVQTGDNTPHRFAPISR